MSLGFLPFLGTPYIKHADLHYLIVQIVANICALLWDACYTAVKHVLKIAHINLKKKKKRCCQEKHETGFHVCLHPRTTCNQFTER